MNQTFDERLDKSVPSATLSPAVDAALNGMVDRLTVRRRRRRLLAGGGVVVALVLGGGTAAFATPAVQEWLTPVSQFSYVASDAEGSSVCSVSLDVVPLTGIPQFSKSDYLAFVTFAHSHPWHVKQGAQFAGKAERLLRGQRAITNMMAAFEAAHPSINLDRSMIITSREHCDVTTIKNFGSEAAIAAATRAQFAARAQAVRSSH